MNNESGNRVLKISYESAMEEVDRLANMERTESGGVEVYSGKHEEYGWIHIVLPSADDAMILLPLVSL